jgi:hypothetical protein
MGPKLVDNTRTTIHKEKNTEHTKWKAKLIKQAKMIITL